MRHLWWKYGGALLLVAGLVGCQTPVAQPKPQGMSAEQLQVLRTHGFQDEEGDWALQVPSKLLFAVGTDQLEATQAEYVSQLGRDLLQVGIHQVRVEGHTDDTGSPQYNQQLSERRAQRVADLLVQAGMPVAQVSTRGWGNAKPLPMVTGETARKENRRVAIIIPGLQAP